MMESIVYNMDCLEAMRAMPDNAFDLAVVDPPYGGGNTGGGITGSVNGSTVTRTGGTWAEKYSKK